MQKVSAEIKRKRMVDLGCICLYALKNRQINKQPHLKRGVWKQNLLYFFLMSLSTLVREERGTKVHFGMYVRILV